MFLPKAVPRARAFLQSKINHGWSATSLTVRAIGTASPLHSTILPQNVGCSSASYDHHHTAYRGLRTSATSLMSLVTHDELAGMIEGTVEVEGGYSLIVSSCCYNTCCGLTGGAAYLRTLSGDCLRDGILHLSVVTVQCV